MNHSTRSDGTAWRDAVWFASMLSPRFYLPLSLAPGPGPRETTDTEPAAGLVAGDRRAVGETWPLDGRG